MDPDHRTKPCSICGQSKPVGEMLPVVALIPSLCRDCLQQLKDENPKLAQRVAAFEPPIHLLRPASLDGPPPQ